MNTQILSPTSENIEKAAQALREGAVVGMPTETVYGLAGSLFNEEALLKIFGVKERPKFDPLIVHVKTPMENALHSIIPYLENLNLIDLSQFSSQAIQKIELLLKNFWPGPFTIVLPKKKQVPDLATSGLTTVALRMPNHPVAQALLKAIDTPIAAPSANQFGHLSPTSAQHVLSEIGGRIEFILDGGLCEVGVESSVVYMDPAGELFLLRPGGTDRKTIEEVAGMPLQAPLNKHCQPASPGMLERHYAPRKPFYCLAESLNKLNWENFLNTVSMEDKKFSVVQTVGILFFSGNPGGLIKELEKNLRIKIISKILSPSGDFKEAARNLFAHLRTLDSSEAEILFAEPCPSHQGLGHAILDRLQRAAAHVF